MIRKLIVLFFAYLIIEGALRKWLFPEASAELFVLKDVILIVGFVAYLAADPKASFSYLRLGELMPWILWVLFVLGFFLAREPSLAGIAGLRYYLAPLPLLVLVPYAIGELRNLQRAAFAVLLVTIPLCILGIIQYVSPLDSEINRYAWITVDRGDVSTFGFTEDLALGIELGRPRITATFSYISTYAAYLMFAVLAAWAVLAGPADTRMMLFASASLLLIFANLAMTGSRAPMAMSVALSIPFAYMVLKKIWRSQSPATAILALLVPMLGAFTLVIVDAFEALALRAQDAGDTDERILGTLLLPFSTLLGIEPFGRGIGGTFGGMAELREGAALVEGFKEVDEDRVGVELGHAGYLLVLYLKCVFLYKSWVLYRECAKAPDLQVWALTALAVQLGSVWQIPFHNAVASSFYFASLGLFLWVRGEFGVRAARNTGTYRPPARSFITASRNSGAGR